MTAFNYFLQALGAIALMALFTCLFWLTWDYTPAGLDARIKALEKEIEAMKGKACLHPKNALKTEMSAAHLVTHKLNAPKRQKKMGVWPNPLNR